MQHRSGRVVFRVGSVFLIAVALVSMSAARAGVVVSVELDYEIEGLDLDTGAVVDLGMYEDVEWDVAVAYNAVRATHAVLMHNVRNGTTVSYLEGTPFESVTHGSAAGLTFSSRRPDRPLRGDDTVVVRTDTGALFKVGRATPAEGGLVLRYERLTSLFTGVPSGPFDGATPPLGLSPEDLREIRTSVRRTEYRAIRRDDAASSLEARNAEHRFRLRFRDGGVAVSPLVAAGDPGWEWTLSLRRFGRSGAMREAGTGRLVADGNRVECRRDDVVEWYVNDEDGLEHGFDVAAPPASRGGSGELRFELERSGSLEARTEKEGSAISFRDALGEPVLRYAGLRAWDAEGRDLPARMFAEGSRLTIAVDDRHAVYPVTVDPTLTEDARLTASDAGSRDYFGFSVAVSGHTVLVGAYRDIESGLRSGSVYVFVRDGDAWIEQAKLLASDAGSADDFGFSVALSGDTALVGAWEDDDAGRSSGSAYVFKRDGTVWHEEAKLTASDATFDDWFGRSVALSGDTALIGAHGDDDARANSGAAYVFTRSGTSWHEEAKLTASDAASREWFGFAVALSGDTALVGTPQNTLGSLSAYVFTRSGGTWSEQAVLVPSEPSSLDRFGHSVALAGDTALIGAPGDDFHGTSSGAVYVFVRDGALWSEQAKLAPRNAAPWDEFGGAVSLSGDAAVIGARGDEDGGPLSGSAYVFRRAGASWIEQAKLVASDAYPGDEFGTAIAVDDDRALIGAHRNDIVWMDDGAAYIFGVSNEPPVARCRDASAEADEDCLGQVYVWDIDDGSYDPDGDPIQLSLDPPGPFPLGTTPVTLTVTDDQDASTSCTATVTVVDVTEPSISVLLSPDILWPPNHRMVEVEASVNAGDNCGPPAIVLLSVTSDEPDDAEGNGDGNTVGDIQDADVGTADVAFLLRAERAGAGDGRTYTATYAATDGSGNETTAAASVQVPHDRGGKTDPVEVGAEETVAGTRLSWSAVDGAAHYNVIRGRLADIAESETTIDLGPVACIEPRSLDVTTEGQDDASVPPPGDAFFYLVEYDNGARSAYGTESASKPRVMQSGDCE